MGKSLLTFRFNLFRRILPIALACRPWFCGLMNKPRVAVEHPIVQELQPGTYWWCSCGESSTQPFCDGSHKGSGFSPLKVVLNEQKRLAFCGCKHSANAPFCDGSHKSLR
ncbi:MAG: CDGSH iron-sulfur domain-containing protein [Verrucomicrobiia bacterium]